MRTDDPAAEAFHRWLAALDARHLADLSTAEVGRALRALSSCYTERRGRLAEGGALTGAGKRAAFALFYAPLHFLVAQHVIRRLPVRPVGSLHDLGCGLGSAGAAWALEMPGTRVTGVDRHPWAVAEANRTYRDLGIRGHARQGELSTIRLPAGPDAGIVVAYAVNELPEGGRSQLLERLLDRASSRTAVLVIEPIAKRVSPWWMRWAAGFTAAGGRVDEWRFRGAIPERARQLARTAGLKPDELTARSLFVQR